MTNDDLVNNLQLVTGKRGIECYTALMLTDWNYDKALAALKAPSQPLAQQFHEAKQEAKELRAAGAVLLKFVYESGIAYGSEQLEGALATFAKYGVTHESL